MKHWKWSLVPLGLLLFGWASSALGSYVYLRGMGYRDDFEFPWCQLWVLVPYIIADGWHGLPSVMTWSWCIAGIASAVMPGVVALILLFQRLADRRRQPSLFGKTGWADRREMRRGGIRSERSPF